MSSVSLTVVFYRLPSSYPVLSPWAMALFFRFVVGKMSNFVGTLAIVFSYSLWLLLNTTHLIFKWSHLPKKNGAEQSSFAQCMIWPICVLTFSLIIIYGVFLHNMVFWEKTNYFPAIGSWRMNGETAGKRICFSSKSSCNHYYTQYLFHYFYFFSPWCESVQTFLLCI